MLRFVCLCQRIWNDGAANEKKFLRETFKREQLFITMQMCLNFTVRCLAMEMRWPHPVELGPGYGHVAIVLRVVAAACESFLCQEDQVILWQASAAVHLCLVLHIKGLAQLWPHDLVWHNKWHPTLKRQRRVVKKLASTNAGLQSLR